ncbi:hypothetical protein HCH_02992 [Hahella chejuensis KCTC 2396]|uniref:Uncharacterized protein n=1 Tax=Hahella chejuensis (strain KCTC 2396) TaxID=349521 RepID=Q2SHW3_HAHCH|nr:hypothetical protein HCH_02992 [Hahella chejuensis KCTC 2396]
MEEGHKVDGFITKTGILTAENFDEQERSCDHHHRAAGKLRESDHPNNLPLMN